MKKKRPKRDPLVVPMLKRTKPGPQASKRRKLIEKTLRKEAHEAGADR